MPNILIFFVCIETIPFLSRRSKNTTDLLLIILILIGIIALFLIVVAYPLNQSSGSSLSLSGQNCDQNQNDQNLLNQDYIEENLESSDDESILKFSANTSTGEFNLKIDENYVFKVDRLVCAMEVMVCAAHNSNDIKGQMVVKFVSTSGEPSERIVNLKIPSNECHHKIFDIELDLMRYFKFSINTDENGQKIGLKPVKISLQSGRQGNYCQRLPPTDQNSWSTNYLNFATIKKIKQDNNRMVSHNSLNTELFNNLPESYRKARLYQEDLHFKGMDMGEFKGGFGSRGISCVFLTCGLIPKI